MSKCFGHPYAHHQEIRLRSIAYSCPSCCSCCDAGELGGKMCAHSAHILPPDCPATQQQLQQNRQL